MHKQRIGLLIINGPLPPPYGGVATFLAHALPHLAGRDFDVHTVIDKRPADPKYYEQYERIGIHIHYGGGSRFNKIVQILKHVPLWIFTLKKSGIDFFVFVNIVKSIVSWLDASERVLQEHNIEIIHAYDYPWVQGFVAAHLARKYKKKYIQTTFGEIVPHEEELVHHDAIGDRYKSFVKYVLDQSNMIVTLSQHCSSEIEFAGISKDKTRITYWGVDVNFFRPELDGSKTRKQFNLGDSHTVLFLGQIRLRKGPQVLIEAAAQVLKEFPDTKFLFAGPDFGLVQQLKNRSKVLGIAESIVFAGVLPQEELPALYTASDVFVFPTCTPIECLGLSMIQAMACAKPVVGSRINGIPEVIIDGETGFLVEPGNPVPLGKKISLLLADASLRSSMGEAGRRRAEQHFDQDRLVVQLEQIYREVLDVA